MNKALQFESENLLYRGITEEDAAQLVKWRSDKHIIEFFQNPTPLTMEQHLKWFQNYMNDVTRFDFIVKCKFDNLDIGFMGINQINEAEKTCFINYTIADTRYRCRGYASESVNSLCKYYKNNRKLDCFYSLVHQKNFPSQKVMAKLKFEKYGQKDDFIIYRLII